MGGAGPRQWETAAGPVDGACRAVPAPGVISFAGCAVPAGAAPVRGAAESELIMHELGIARGILDIVDQYVPSGQEEGVRTVRVRVGTMAGIVPDSLEFCFSAIVAESRFPGAHLEIESVPTRGDCAACGRDFEIECAFFLCPHCGAADVRIVSGRELDVIDIELAEDGGA
jgi:hydrogenase nickel incorporation protein HypA/HybF